MKKIIGKLVVFLLLFGVICQKYNVSEAYAAEIGTITLSVSSTELEKGESVKVTVTMNTTKPIDDAMFQLVYDNKVLSCSGYSGVINIDVDDNTQKGVTSFTQTYDFTVISVPGNNTTSISVQNVVAVSTDMEEGTLATRNATISVIDHRASANANLSDIDVSNGYLSPRFNANTTSYSVGLDNSITSINLSATAEDSAARVSFDSSALKNLKVGQTDVVITVTAENGATKNYTVSVIRYEARQEETTKATEKPSEQETETAKPETKLTVNVDGKEYTVLKDISTIALPSGFELSVDKYLDTDVAVAENTATKMVLMYLNDSDGNGAFYIYDKTKKTFQKYQTVSAKTEEYVILTPDKTLENTTMVRTEINGQEVKTYTNKDIEDIYFFYAMNSKGEKGWYSFDSKEGTIQRMYSIKEEIKTADDKVTDNKELEELKLANSKLKREVDSLKSSKTATFRLIGMIVLAVLCVILLGVILYLISKNKSDKDKYDELVDSSIEMKKKYDETLEMVASTEEKFANERQMEKEEASASVPKEEEKVKDDAQAQSVDEDVLKSEIDIALEKLSKFDEDDAVNIKFDNNDDDIL